MVIGARIPEKYVVVKGAGQTSFGPGIDPWETAAYDIALLDAGIENCNIVKYTSVLPPQSKPISMEEAIEDGLMHYGMVLESIMAQVNGNKGDHICAGVGRCQVYCGGEHIGGFAAEYEGHGSEELAQAQLSEALDGIFQRRYGHSPEYIMCDVEMTTQDLIVDEQYGTVLVALGFLTFLVAEL